MARVRHWVVPWAVVGMVTLAAVGLGSGDQRGISYDTSASTPPPAPELPKEPQRSPPPEIDFTGTILIADPTGLLFGPDALLWHQACTRLDVTPARYTSAEASLTAGTTEGDLEDLDLFAYDEAGARVAEATGPTSGIGVHHVLDIGPQVTHLLVCLAGGSHGAYRVHVS